MTDPAVCISIRDDGPGITEEIRESIFEPFFTTKFTGRGLGLSVAMGILHKFGGELELADQAPGCTFRIWLPIRSAPADTEAIPAP